MQRPVARPAAAAGKIPTAERHFVTDPNVNLNGESGTSTSLLRRAATRQPDAWDKLVSLYGPLVYRWCRRWGLQAKDAENVGQEVFLRVLQGLPAFRRDRPGDSFRGWLRRIARNCCLDQVHHQKTVAQPIGGSDALDRMAAIAEGGGNEEPSATECEDTAVLYDQAMRLIRSEFSERDWMIFRRLVVGGETPSAIAVDLKITANVVYLTKSRVLHRLREEFAELIEF
jgi:RNA polymerase sigma-70 factor (ECF subfamily)